MAHRGTAVGTWLSYGGRPPDCTGCDFPSESQRHCLWDCPLTQQIWLRILRLMTWIEGQQISCGAVAWGTLSGPAMGYEDTSDGVILMSQQGFLVTTRSIRASTESRDGDPRWELISSLTMWFVWRARCRWIFDQRVIAPAEMIRDLWLELIHTLRG